MIDKFDDLYGGPNYTRLFLLFFLFLAVMYYWMSSDIYSNVSAYQDDVATLLEDECLSGGDACATYIS